MLSHLDQLYKTESSISSLYITKKQQEVKVEPPELKVAKIRARKVEPRKVDVADMNLELDPFEYDIIKGIKIYNGVQIEKKSELLNDVEFYKIVSDYTNNNVFTPLVPSTLTTKGFMSHIDFSEDLHILQLPIPNKIHNKIIKIGCNYGEIISYPNPYVDYNIEYLIRSIKIFGLEKIKIGCECSNLLQINDGESNIDIRYILNTVDKIDAASEQFINIVKLTIIPFLENEWRYNKKRLTLLRKRIKLLMEYSLTSKNEINDLYEIVEMATRDNELLLCNNFLNNITIVIDWFMQYEANCRCYPEIAADADVKQSVQRSKSKDASKKKSKRKIQGVGIYFNSQISFDIYNTFNKKIYKFKLFRNGNFQVPGIKHPLMQDFIGVAKTIECYMQAASPWGNIVASETFDITSNIKYLLSVTRNYKFNLGDLNMSVLTNRLKNVLEYEKTLPDGGLAIAKNLIKREYDITNLNKFYGVLFPYMNLNLNPIDEINNNNERHPGLLIKFNRPIPPKPEKKLTLKILSSGKINIDGSNNSLETECLYYWLIYIFNKYWNEIIYDPVRYANQPVSDSDEYESIYDSD